MPGGIGKRDKIFENLNCFFCDLIGRCWDTIVREVDVVKPFWVGLVSLGRGWRNGCGFERGSEEGEGGSDK